MKTKALVTTIVMICLSAALMGSVAHAEDKPVTKTYPFTQQCTGNVGGWCTPTRAFEASTKGLLELKYTASTQHCSPVDVQFSVEQGLSQSKYAMHNALAPGKSVTSAFNMPPGTYTVSVTVKDAPGGCDGQVQSWGGTMQITTMTEGTSNTTSSPTTKPKSSTSNGSSSGPGTSDSGSGSGSGGGSANTSSDGSASSGGSSTTSGDSDSPESSGSPSDSSSPLANASPGTLAAQAASDRTSFPWWVIVVAIVVLAALAGGGGYMYWRRQQDHS